MKRLMTLLGAVLLLAASVSALAKVHVFACQSEWAALAREIGGERVEITTGADGVMAVLFDGKMFHPALPRAIYDLDAHLQVMDAAGVDVHALSIPPPMVYWAEPQQGLELCRIANDALSAARGAD